MVCWGRMADLRVEKDRNAAPTEKTPMDVETLEAGRVTITEKQEKGGEEEDANANDDYSDIEDEEKDNTEEDYDVEDAGASREGNLSEPGKSRPKKQRQSVKVGPREFRNGKAMFHFFYNLFKGWPQNFNINKYEHMMLEDLLKQGHPEPQKKIGVGIEAFQVRMNPDYNSPCFYVIRKDGSVEDFSFRKCVGNLLPLPEHLKSKKERNPLHNRHKGGPKGSQVNKGGRTSGLGRGGGRGNRGRHSREV